MDPKTRRKLVYVLSSSNSSTGHSLGVNALALAPETCAKNDQLSGVLYSGGRDGLINSWGLYDMDLHISEDVNSSLQGVKMPNSAPIKPSTSGTTKALTSAQVHTNWVNDLVLTTDYTRVISCSSDLTVKVWTPNSGDQSLIGRHSDYTKCLTNTIDNDKWIVSGGLDRKIIGWDLEQLRGEKFSIDVGNNGTNPKGSIYALTASKNNPTPLLASGGPQGIVSMWDPRDAGSTREVMKFVGHTENIRSLLVSQDSKWVLSASSDSTIKLWSTAAGRLFHSFDMHNDSVWSLFSLNDQLNVFYSADRSGTVLKTELRGCPSKTDLDEGFSTMICNEHKGVFKIAACDNYIWTATSNSWIHRWQNIDTSPLAVAAAATNTLPTPAENGIGSKTGIIGSATSLSKLTTKLAEIRPFEARTTPPQTNGGTTATNSAPQSPGLTPTTSAGQASGTKEKKSIKTSFLGLFGGPATNMLSLERHSRQTASDILRQRPEDLSVTIEPRFNNPLETLEGRVGLLKHRLLSDRRRALTLDTAGDIKLWDLVTGKVLQSFEPGVYEDLDDLADQLSTFSYVSNWCQVSIQTGELFVCLDPTTCFDAEVYGDELLKNEDLTKYDAENPTSFPDDHRLNYGKWVIVNLLRNLMDVEMDKIQHLLDEHDEGSEDGTQETTVEDVVQHIVEPIPKTTAPQQADTPEKSGSKFMGKLRGFGKKKEKKEKEIANESTAKPVPIVVPQPPAPKVHENMKNYMDDVIEQRKAGQRLFKPVTTLDAPKVQFEPSTKILISESSRGSGGSVDLYRGTVGGIIADQEQLEKVLPEWIAKLILNNEQPKKEPVKVGFALHSMDNNVKEISDPNVRLTAFQMLRAHKIKNYVTDRLNGSNDMERIDVDLYCQNQKLQGDETLATIRTKYWRSGGDVVLKYKMVKKEKGAEAL